MDEANLTQFRQKIVEDEEYRHRFCENPAEALKEVGIDVPEGTEIPAIDKQDFDERINNLRVSFKGRMSNLYSMKSLSTQDMASVNSTLGIGNPIQGGPGGLAGGGITDRGGLAGGGGAVYTISAFGTADW